MRQYTWIIVIALLAGGLPAQGAEALLQVAPSGACGLEFTRDGSLLMSTGVTCWGAGWKWFGFPGPAKRESDSVRALKQTTIMPDSSRLNFSEVTSQIDSHRIECDLGLLCPKETPLVGIAWTIHPEREVQIIRVKMSDGSVQQTPLPIKRGAIAGMGNSVLVTFRSGQSVEFKISPARSVEAENDEIRIWAGKDRLPGGEAVDTKITMITSEATKFYPGDFDAVVNDITPEWFPYPVGQMGTPVDLSFLNKDEKGNYIPAGAHGFVKVNGDDFVFEDGTPARFWGVNVTAYAALGTAQRAEQIAEGLARLGMNIVRLHHLDSDWVSPNLIDRKASDGTTQHLNEEGLRRLDRMIFELKKRGIYVILDPWVGRSYRPGDDITSSDKFDKGNFGFHPYIFFDPHMQELHKKFLAQLWSHVNEYTHLAYKDDPAIALTEVCNEFLYRNNFNLEPYRSEYYSLYQQWAKENGADENPGEKLFTVNYTVPHEKFYMHIMRRFFAEFYQYDRRELGLKIPINASNWFHWPWEIACQTDADFMDAHHYYGGDRIGAGSGMGGLWVEHPPGVPNSPFGPIGAMAILGKPLTVSECGNNPPKTYRSAYYIGLAAVACLQGWDAITPFAYAQNGNPATDLRAYEMESDPATIASMAVGALIYRRGDVKQAKELAVMTLPENEQFAMHWENGGEKAFQNTRQFNVALETHKVAVFFGDKSRLSGNVHPAEIMEPGSAFAHKQNGTEIRSDTGEMWRDWKIGVGTIDTDRTQAAYGKLGESQQIWRTKDCQFDIKTPFATVAISSLNDRPIRQSEHLLLTVAARAENSGMTFNLVRTRVTGTGTAPVIAEGVEGVVQFKTKARTLVAKPVRADGPYGNEVRVEIKDGVASVSISAKDRCLFYEIATDY